MTQTDHVQSPPNRRWTAIRRFHGRRRGLNPKTQPVGGNALFPFPATGLPVTPIHSPNYWIPGIMPSPFKFPATAVPPARNPRTPRSGCELLPPRSFSRNTAAKPLVLSQPPLRIPESPAPSAERHYLHTTFAAHPAKVVSFLKTKE